MAKPCKKPLFNTQSRNDDNSNLVLGTIQPALNPSKTGFLKKNKKNGVKNGLSFKDFRNQLMGRYRLPYKSPKIVRCKNGDWFVQFYYFNNLTGKFKAFKTRSGINYIKEAAEKERAAAELCSDVLRWLKAGNSPFDKEKRIIQYIEKAEAEIKEKKVKFWSITEAIIRFKTFTANQNYSPRTIHTYNNYLADFIEWIKANNLGYTPAKDFTEYQVQKFLNSNGHKWSARTFNNYLKFYAGFFNRCHKLEKAIHRGVVYTFDIDNVDLKITKSQKNKPYTPVLANKIKEALRKGDVNLKEYIEWIYLSLMRPAEIRALKVQDIDEQSRHIRIIGKTGDRLIPISDQLLSLVRKRCKTALPGDYVFGEAGKVSAHRMSVDYFLNKYRALLNNLNISDDYGPYSWKSTAICDMINAGFTDKEIMVLSGHKTQKAFEIYKRDLVIDNSHLMKGSVLEF